MSTSVSQPKTTTTSQTEDKRIVTGDGSLIAQEGGSIHVENLDAGLAEQALKLMQGLAENSNDGAYSLSKYAIDIGETITGQMIDAMAKKDEQFNTLFDNVTKGTQTTMRDVLATVATNSGGTGSYLAGSTAQSGGISGWISRNPLIAGVISLVLGFLGYTALTRKTKKQKK